MFTQLTFSPMWLVIGFLHIAPCCSFRALSWIGHPRKSRSMTSVGLLHKHTKWTVKKYIHKCLCVTCSCGVLEGLDSWPEETWEEADQTLRRSTVTAHQCQPVPWHPPSLPHCHSVTVQTCMQVNTQTRMHPRTCTCTHLVSSSLWRLTI